MKILGSILLTAVLVTGCKVNRAEEDWTPPLHEALAKATRLHIRTGGTCHRNPENEKTLLDIQDAKEIANFIRQIKIQANKSGFHCMCCGEPTLEFYHDDTLILSLGFHHGRSLRWPNGDWKGDGLLTKESSDFLIHWFSDHGVQGPHEEVQESLRRQKQSAASQEKWLSAMPTSLKPFWNTLEESEIVKMNAALTKQFQDPKQQILALLEWYGSGEGPWSGFPSYESVAEDLLLLHKTERILETIHTAELTQMQIEGAARLFGGWHFSQQRPEDLRLLPDTFKQQLLEHCLKSENRDKKARAIQAFETKKKPKNPLKASNQASPPLYPLKGRVTRMTEVGCVHSRHSPEPQSI
jgi:hypothetical protein